MAAFKLTRLPKNTLEIEITVPWQEISKSRDKVVNEAVKTTEIKGFRKGMAPAELVKKSLDPDKLIQAALNDTVPKAYSQAVTELAIKPVLLPQIRIVSAEEGKDWVLSAKTCEAPQIILDGYKDKIKGELSAAKIWTPQTSSTSPNPKSPNDPNAQTQKEELLDKIIDWLIKNIPVEISDLLIEEEANHMLSKLFDQLQKLGLTVDQYLASKSKTTQQLRTEFAQSASDNLKLEFILGKIAQTENISVSEDEVDNWIKSADPQTQQTLAEPSQKASLKSILTRRQTLDFLVRLA